MSDMRITLSNGITLTYPQAMTLARKVRELEHCHWHLNNCGCCVSIHGRDCAYVINSDGEETFFPDRGCACEMD